MSFNRTGNVSHLPLSFGDIYSDGATENPYNLDVKIEEATKPSFDQATSAIVGCGGGPTITACSGGCCQSVCSSC